MSVVAGASTKCTIATESREKDTITKRKNYQKLPSCDSDVGKHCQKCGSLCPGFMPHLWRKRCTMCGCGRHQHQKDIVSLEAIQSMDGASLQYRCTAQERSLKTKYAWHPKGATADEVEQYMQCFPTECVPLFGSKGEEWREAEFMKQLPAYDTCPEACHDMADIDKKRMIKFVDMRRKKCFGVGEIEVLSECKVK